MALFRDSQNCNTETKTIDPNLAELQAFEKNQILFPDLLALQE
jgi:hypothetical protein